MPRRPAHVEAARGGSPRERLWSAIRKLKSFTFIELLDASKVDERTARNYLTSLVKGGYVALDGTKPIPKRWMGAKRKEQTGKAYKLARDVGIEAPRVKPDGSPVLQGRAREQMWRTMKMLVQFTYVDLALAASTDEVQVAEDDAKDYLKHLLPAGYVAVVKHSNGPASKSLYRFVKSKNTGPKPPQVQRTKCVYDPNLRQIVWHEEIDA